MRAAVLHAHGAAPAYADHADPVPELARLLDLGGIQNAFSA